MVLKPSCKQLKAFMKEEAKTSKEYRKMGFISQAKDEARHSKFFWKLAKVKCNS